MTTVNKGHYHEIVDRLHIVCCMLDDHVIEHPGTTDEMNTLCEEAQHSLCKAMSLAAVAELKFEGTE